MENRRIFKPELLLPAGDVRSVAAAVQNGADAVYLGGKLFSARANAANFDEAALTEAVRYCHIRGVKVYQTLNTLLFDAEFPRLEQAVFAGCAAGVDAFIIQDMGVLSLVREMAPAMRIHASTQMTVHTPEGARLLAEMGVRRVVLARELTLEEIRAVASAAEIETEVFVHGALCMSVSGQCYLSGMLGSRSGNRGSCAGSCRLPFSPDGREGYALSLKDLCAAERIRELAEAGVASLKVEGRMKRPEYVAAAAAAYRSALDGEAPDLQPLQAVFSRSGFTSGYLDDARGPSMFGHRRKDDVTAATPGLLRELEHTYQKERGRVSLDLRFTAAAGAPVELELSDREGHTALVEGEIPQAAQRAAATEESVRRQLLRLGGTPFSPGECAVSLEDGLYLPAAALNALRRSACEEMERLRGAVQPVACCPPEPMPQKQAAYSGFTLAARFASYAQIPFEETDGLSSFSLPLEEAAAHVDELFPYRSRIVLEPDRVNFENEAEQIRLLGTLKQKGFSRMLCNHLAQLRWAKKLGMQAEGGPFLNCANSRAAAEYAALGASSLTLSFECSLRDGQRVTSPVPLGAVVYGSLPLMVLRSCPMRQFYSCGECGGKKTLTDRLGVHFPVVCHNRRYSELLNSRPMMLSDRLREFSGFSFGTLYFTTETAAQVREVLAQYRTEAPARGEFTRGLYYRSV
jgi:putative protease